MRNKALYIWQHFEEIILIPAFAVSTALIFIQIVLRSFNTSLAWSEELVRYMYVWETWIGVSYAVKRGSHLRITMLKDKLTGRKRMILECFVLVVWIAFAIFIIFQSTRSIDTIMSFQQKSSALRIPMQYCYSSIPVGISLMSIRLIEEAIRQIKQINKEKMA